MEKIFLLIATVALFSGCGGRPHDRTYVVEKPVVVEETHRTNDGDRVYVEDRGTERVYVKERVVSE